MASTFKIPEREAPKTEVQQTVKDFTKEKLRRFPTIDKKAIQLYYWHPNETSAKVSSYTRKRNIKLVELCRKYYPKMEFKMNYLDFITVGKGKDAITKYRRDVFYVASKLLDQFYSEVIKGEEDGVFGHVLLTPMRMTQRPGIVTDGLAKRMIGVACVCTCEGKSSDLTLIHEIGHLFGLRHCQNSACIMRAGKEENFALLGKETRDDEKTSDATKFCDTCLLKLSEATRNLRFL
jgi:hypothetical protein